VYLFHIHIHSLSYISGPGTAENSAPPRAVNQTLFHWLGRRELLAAIHNFLARPIEADRIVPALHDRQEVWLFGVAAEVDGHAAVLVFLTGDIVHRIGLLLVLLEIAFPVIKTDRPESVHRHIFHLERVSGLAIIMLRRDARIHGIFLRIATPAGGAGKQELDRVDFVLAAGAETRVSGTSNEPSSCSAGAAWRRDPGSGGDIELGLDDQIAVIRSH